MSRNVGATNAAIFRQLIDYAADRDVAIPLGERRVFLDEEDFDTLVGARCLGDLRIGRHQAAVLLQTAHGEVLAVSGFETERIHPSPSVREIEPPVGIVVAAIADLKTEPTATPFRILDVVGAASKADTGYSGHDADAIRSLFPRLRFLEIDPQAAGPENLAANLLIVCAAESAEGNGWINESLAEELVRLAEQRIAGFPYEFLVRATLDLDPSNLFLALYRCLEATYAFARASELVLRLGVTDKTWFEVARMLGESLSWYPRHDQSLAAILSLDAVQSNDLDALAVAVGVGAVNDIPSGVSARVREIRNSLVHYGPTTRPTGIGGDAWNSVCVPLARIVGDVFAHTYGALAAREPQPTPVQSTVESAPRT